MRGTPPTRPRTATAHRGLILRAPLMDSSWITHRLLMDLWRLNTRWPQSAFSAHRTSEDSTAQFLHELLVSGCSMACLRSLYGVFKVALWFVVGGHRAFFGVLKVFTWRVCGRSLACLRSFYGVLKVALWRVVGGHRACIMSFFGVLKVAAQRVCGRSMACLRSLCGVSKLALRSFYGVPLVVIERV